MASAAEDDPFLQVQADVLATLEATRPLFTSYLRIRSIAASAASPELTQARTELEQQLQSVSVDLQDLVESVRAVEQDPQRYGLSPAEVSRRRRLVDEVGGEIEDMREELLKTVTAAAGGAASKGKGAASGASVPSIRTDLPDPSAFQDPANDDAYAAYEQQRQQELLHEQDEALDDVFKTVGNLRQQADTMGRELEEQGQMLGEVDTLTDRLGGKLKGGMQKLNVIIRKNEEKGSTWCIAILIFILVLLLIIAIAL